MRLNSQLSTNVTFNKKRMEVERGEEKTLREEPDGTSKSESGERQKGRPKCRQRIKERET